MIGLFSKLQIRTKIGSCFSFLLLLISLFIFIYYPKQQKEQTLKTLGNKVQSMTEMVALGTGIAMETDNFSAIDQALNWAKRDSNLSLIIVLDTENEEIASYNSKNLKLNLEEVINKRGIVKINENMYCVTPIRYLNTDYGMLILGYSLREVSQTIHNQKVTTFYIILLIMIAGVIFSIMFSNMITKPIIQLRNAAKEVSKGKTDVKINVTTSDEIGELGATFNEMTDKIQTSKEMMEKINVKLKESEEQFRGAFDNAPIGVALINSEGHFLRVNRMFCKMLKYSRKELIDKSAIDIVYLDDKEDCSRLIREIFCDESAATHQEIRYVNKEGIILWIRIRMALHRKDLNSQIEIILQAIDISQRREDEEIAAKVQKNLLPDILPDIPGVNIKWSIKTCDELAGDTLNIFWLRDNYIGFYIIDVSGHGLAASLLSVKLSTIFSPYQIWNPSIERKIGDNSDAALRPAKLLKQLNENFPIDLDTGQYFTIVYGYLNVETHELCFSSAGHPAPIHLSKNEKAKIIKSKSLPIGFRKDAKYNEHKIKLKSGDRIFFYTDGIIEAKTRNGEEFGLHNLTKAVYESYEKTLDASFCLLDEMMVSWNGKTKLEDDVSILAIEIAK